MAKPKKYEHIDFKPTKAMKDAAKRGLELRKKNKGKGGLSTQQAGKAGIGSGVARARDIINSSELSPQTVKRMHAFFSRSAKNKKPSGGKPLSEDKGYIAHLIWGGDPGASWARKIVKQMEAADKKKAELIKTLVKIAHACDSNGLPQYADRFDSLLRSLNDSFSVAELESQVEIEAKALLKDSLLTKESFSQISEIIKFANLTDVNVSDE